MSARNKPIPQLFGLALAGGEGRRMGEDKGALVYYGETQVEYVWKLLASLCSTSYVSTSKRGAAAASRLGLPVIQDENDFHGPAAGLAAAWKLHPKVAWLVLAIDMPLVDRDLIGELIAARDPSAVATAFQHEDGVIEPLCTIYEPAARRALQNTPSASLRRFLESHVAVLLRPSDPAKLASANRPEEYEALRRELNSHH